MKFLKIFLPICLMAIVNITAFSQGSRGATSTPEERAKQQTDMMTEKLSLSEKQAVKVGEINLKYAQKMADARKEVQDDDWTAMRETMTKMREEQNGELKGVMTAAQFENWQKIQEEQRAQRRNRGRERSDKPQNDNKG